MKQKTENIKKLKRAGTIIAVAGGLTLGAVAISNTQNKVSDSTENKEYFKQLKNTANKMTLEQKQQFIQVGEEMLQKLQEKIDSDTTNPEEQFEARLAQRQITEELKIMRKNLQKER